MTMFATADKANPVPTNFRLDPRGVLPLHAELYLLAHDDDTGNLLINQQSLELGLAGALLLELAFKEYVAVGYHYDDFRRQWQRQPGRLTLCQSGPTANTLWDAALTTVEQVTRTHRDADQLRAVLRSFAAADLYERVRAALVTVGLLQRTTRRRLAGLVKTETHLPVHYGFAVRARAHIRDAVAHYAETARYRPTPPGDECAALCGLVAALELADFLYDAMPVRDLNPWLEHVADNSDNQAISAVVRAVDAGRGDLAVAAMH
jgi:Golgi phosphoprotein 3 GPP34